MFKCKQCGRQFGANTPKVCPGCGATEQADREERGLRRLFIVGAYEAVIQLLLLATFIGLVIGAVGWLLGWFG